MSADDTPAFPATLRAVYNATTPASRVIADLAPQLLARNVLQSLPPRPDDKRALQDSRKSRGLLATIGRGPAKALLPSGGRRVESSSTTSALDLAVIESVDDLLDLPIVSPSTSSHEKLLSSTLSPTPDAASSVSLFAGFQATAPSASQSRKNRRRRRAYLSESHLGIAHGSQLGLKSRVDHARGLLASSSSSTILEETSSVSSKSLGDDTLIEGEGDFEIIRHATSSPKRSSAQSTPRVRKTMAASHYKSNPDAPASERLSKAELLQDVAEIEQDQHHLQTRRHVLTQEAAALDEQIHKLQASRDVLRKGLLGLKEEELELQDELDGVREQLESIDLSSSRPSMLDPTASPRNNVPATSRRRKGPAFLPNEHDSLPVGVAFMPLHGHNAPIAALDFSEPYGLLVSSSAGADDSSMRVWDLSTGTQVDTLQISKQEDAIKCLQVESTFCVSGQADGHLKVWDLEKLGEDAAEMGSPTLGSSLDEVEGPCVLDLEAHTKAITSLYFDGPCLVTGSSDKTLRQWDLGTGQSILTMDILWAMNDPASTQTLSASPTMADLERQASESAPDPLNLAKRSERPTLGGSLRRLSSQHYRLSDPRLHDLSQPWSMHPNDSPNDFSVPTPSYADGSWDLYSDFVGGLQFWGYALASGSADGCVRMWDMRTGQAHRTLVGHAAPVTSLQFDEYHLVSGSLDKTIRVWDLRTGSISDTLRFDGPVTALQFDTRKIVAAAGDNGVKVYNRTSMQHESLVVNGHTSPVERIRFMDRYLASGGKDHAIQLWSVQ